MQKPTEADRYQASAPATAMANEERRRPGRTPNVSPELIPILREQPMAPLEQDDPDDLAPAVGVAVCVALSAPIWIGFISLIWFLP